MSTIHTAPFDGAYKTFSWQGQPFRVEDWWDRIYGESWMWSKDNPAALKYAMRTIATGIPDDNEVVYGKDPHGLGHLVHISELKDGPAPPTAADMRAVFGEPVEGRDYDVMPDPPEGGVR